MRRTIRERSKRHAGCCCIATELFSVSSLARETILPKWREVLITLRRLEDRGEIRGGRLSVGFWASNSHCPWPWSRCEPSVSRNPTREVYDCFPLQIH